MGETSDPGAKAGLSIESKKVEGVLSKLYKQVESQSKVWKDNAKSVKAASKAQQDGAATLRKAAAGFSGADVFKGVVSGITQGGSAGIAKALGAVGKGAGGLAAKAANAAAGGGPKGDAAAGQMGSAVAALGTAAMVLAELVQLFMSLSSNAATLNKALTSGIGLAGDMGAGAGEYTKALNNMRTAAMQSSGALVRFGMDAEGSLRTVGAFAKEASGSIVQTEKMLRDMGKGDLNVGLVKFAKDAQLYGKVIGASSEDVAKMMGGFVTEIGISADNVQTTMGNIVKQATQAGMPVHKFMDIFHEAVPNLDLFTNRIEELTGTMKLLSKTMDPRSVKGFMQAFGKGFDQMDFKQRLKMVFVVGPGKMADIMNKGVKRATAAIGQELGPDLSKKMTTALQGNDPIKAMRDVAGEAMAKGVPGATIEAMNKAARMAAMAKSKDPLKMATGMRDMGLMERMESLESYAGAFTGGDLTGLGEHVAKQLGVSEAEYKAIIALKDNMGDLTSQVRKTGRTSSVSLNNNLKKMMGFDKKGLIAGSKEEKENEEAFEAAMKKLPQKDLEDKLKEASISQTEADLQIAKGDEGHKQSLEELTTDNVNATTSIGEQVENVIKVLLQKLYFIFDEVLGLVGSLYDALPGWITHKYPAEAKQLDKWTKMASEDKRISSEGLDYYKKMNSQLKDQVASGASSESILQQNKDALMKMGLTFEKNADGQLVATKASKDMQASILRDSGMSEEEIEKFQTAAENFDMATTTDMMQDMNPAQMAKLVSSAGYQVAKGMKDTDIGTGVSAKVNPVKERREKALNDQDKRTAELYGASADQMQKMGLAAADPKSGDPGFIGPPLPPGAAAADKKGVTKEELKAIQAVAPSAAVGAPGAPPGAPPGAASKTPEPPPGHDAQIKIMEDSGKSQEEVAKYAADDFQNTSDLLSLMKKGIKFEDSWMKNKYANVLKTSTLDSFRTALLEFAVIEAKMGDESFKKSLAASGEDLLGSGLQLKDLAGAGSGENDIKNMIDKAKSHATGLMGVPYDNYLASLHKGEIVMPASDARVAGKGGGGGKTTNVVVYAQGVPASEVARRIGQIANTD
jgi:hypothetical protein